MQPPFPLASDGWPDLRPRLAEPPAQRALAKRASLAVRRAPSQLRRTAATSARQPLFQILRDCRELLHRRAPVLLEDGEDVLEEIELLVAMEVKTRSC